jgi:choline kinase
MRFFIKTIKQPINKFYGKNTLNVLITAAGAGSRLRAFYQMPKPLIDIAGKPMIQRVIESLNIEANYIFIVQHSGLVV